MSDPIPYVSPAEEWVRDEQESLWTDLEFAIRDAMNGTWSEPIIVISLSVLVADGKMALA